MEILELLVALSKKGYVFKMNKNNLGYSYEIKKLGDNPIGSHFSIILEKENRPWNLYWDNPTGQMNYKTLQEVHDYLVLGECKGTWKASRWSSY